MNKIIKLKNRCPICYSNDHQNGECESQESVNEMDVWDMYEGVC